MARLFTLGIEEEFQLIDPETRDLRSHIQEMFEEGKDLLAEQIKPEMHQSVVEVGTHVCADIKEARREVRRLRSAIWPGWRAATACTIAAAGTHPVRALAGPGDHPQPALRARSSRTCRTWPAPT